MRVLAAEYFGDCWGLLVCCATGCALQGVACLARSARAARAEVVRVQTKGQLSGGQWFVKKYSLSYSMDGNDWTEYQERASRSVVAYW